MKQFYPLNYLIDHPEKYNRIEPEDMKDNDAVVTLCTEILKGIRMECDSIVNALIMSPTNAQLRKQARQMNKYLLSDEISTISFGGSDIYAKEFRASCPEGVF